ncbi:MAG: type II toxin-antitoxin system RelE/ParE family toxin [Sedimenticola sp.]
MERDVITHGATQGFERWRGFLREKNPQAMKRAGLAIEQQFALLETEPGIGRPLDDFPKLRELIIPFGDSGYIALYRHEVKEDTVYVLAFRHQKEAGYE